MKSGRTLSFHDGTTAGYTHQINVVNPNIRLYSADWLPNNQGFIATGYDLSATCGLSAAGGIWRINSSGDATPIVSPSCARDGLHIGYFSVTVAPNQSSYAYLRANTANGQSDVRVASLDGTNDRSIADAGSDTSWSNPAWSSDSKELFANSFNPSSGDNRRIERINVSSGSRVNIISSTTSYSYHNPTSGLSVDPLGVPANLFAASPTQQPHLTWDGVSNATSYNVYRNGVLIASADDNTYVDTTAPEGTHTYTLSAVNASAESTQSSPISVLVDRSKPTITYTIDDTPNGFGWNKSAATVTFSCSDNEGGSGTASCSNPVNFSDEGEGQTTTGTVTDRAGNTASVIATVNIDSALPAISASVTPSANTFGWHNSDATLNFECADALSGIDTCTGSAVISNETASQNVNGTARDKAGNEATVTRAIKLDKTAPVLATP
ncbi:MAG: hypothetical protein V4678_00795, partial [Patescibacteria group bacterium]